MLSAPVRSPTKIGLSSEGRLARKVNRAPVRLETKVTVALPLVTKAWMWLVSLGSCFVLMVLVYTIAKGLQPTKGPKTKQRPKSRAFA